MTDKAVSINARAAAKGGAVTIEDEPVVKTCSSCHQSLSPSSFSGAQLKLKAKRKCKTCIQQQQQQANEVQSASSAAASPAAASFAAPSSATSVSAFASSAAKPATPQPPLAARSASAADELPSSCCVCGNQRGKLRACGRCASAYCGLACLKQHSGHGMCESARTRPPLNGIAEEDRLSVEELAELWPLLQRLCKERQEMKRQNELQVPPERRSEHIDLNFSSDELSPLVKLYPPRLAAGAVWWSPRCSRAHANVAAVFPASHRFIATIQCSDRFSGYRIDPSLPQGWGRAVPGPPSPIFADRRLTHRLLVHAIYFFRHVDPLLLRPELRPHTCAVE
jgi:hypothetical protein